MDNKDSFHLLLINKKSIQDKKKKKSREKKRFDTLCNYGNYPISNPMNIDDYDFTFRKKFLSKLSKLYDTIRNEGKKNRIMDVHEISPKLFIRDILTEYTVNNIFKTHSQNDLIHIINTIMRSMYDQFYKETQIRLYFVYRGGNILKMYKNQFEHILPGKARKILQEEFDPYFKLSDIDFYTIIEGSENMSVEEILLINGYIQMMCYYGVYVTRLFVMNNFNLFEFCKYNEITVQEEFQELLNKINERKKESEYSEIARTNFVGIGFNKYMYMKDGYDIDKILNLSDDKIIDEFIHNTDDINVFQNYKKYRTAGRFDLNITPGEDVVDINKIDYKQKNIFTYNFSKEVDELAKKDKIFDYYISNNNQILNKEEYINFSLVRLMINYIVVYERNGKFGLTNTSSELFDLSIGQPNDKVYKIYTSKSIVPYSFKYGDDLEDEIYIPSLETTIVDLTKILFDLDFPWEDEKYVKRLYRLFVLLFIREISNQSLDEVEKLLKSTKKRAYVNEYDITFETLRYRNDEIKNKLPTKYKKEYKEYIESYKEIIKKLLNVVAKLKDFVISETPIQKRDIYNFL